MKLYLDTSAWQLSLTAGSNQTSVSIPAVLGTTLRLEIIPSSTLSSDAIAVMSAKKKGIYTGTPVARALSWTPPSTSDGGYIIELGLNTNELTALFAANPDSVLLSAQITITDEEGVHKTQLIALVVSNQVSGADEAAPSPVVAAPSFLLSSTDGSQWQVAIGNDGQLSQTKLP